MLSHSMRCGSSERAHRHGQIASTPQGLMASQAALEWSTSLQARPTSWRDAAIGRSISQETPVYTCSITALGFPGGFSLWSSCRR